MTLAPAPLPVALWSQRAEAYRQLVNPVASAFMQRRSLGQKHPVYDFLFTYYTFSPTKLLQWVPTGSEQLQMPSSLLGEHSWLQSDWFQYQNEQLAINRERCAPLAVQAQFIATF